MLPSGKQAAAFQSFPAKSAASFLFAAVDFYCVRWEHALQKSLHETSRCGNTAKPTAE